MLGDEVDTSLIQVEQELAACDNPAERLATLMHDFLLDSRQVHASMALVTAATSDTSLRSLALRRARSKACNHARTHHIN